MPISRRRLRRASLRSCWLVLAACASQSGTQAPADSVLQPVPQETTEPVEAAGQANLTALREHVAFLADDAQRGRAPGTEADRRVQAYLVEVMKGSELEPAFASAPGSADNERSRTRAYVQPFEVTDGVKVVEDGTASLQIGNEEVPTSLLPFSTSTQGRDPAKGRLIFVGHGIGDQGNASSDYEAIGKRVKGKIVVALAGAPDDPDLSAAHTRPQSRAIAARDHGAVGFVWWDPTSNTPLPNHGSVHDSRLPALAVGKEGNAALVRALTGKSGVTEVDVRKPPIQAGATSKKRASISAEIEPVTLQTANVAGVVPAASADAPIVVVGAHMDHLGLGTASSLAPGEEAIHNGADDNASGVAAVLEICRALTERPQAQRPWEVHCVAFGAEEMGLLGSKHYVEQLGDESKKRIAAMINFDMVGRLEPEGVMVAGAGTSSLWPELLESHRGELKMRTTEDGYGPSDHGSFYEAGIPVLHFFTGPHDDYHRPSDDVAKINFEGMKRITDMALGVVTELLERQPEIDYKKTKRTTRTGPRSFRVSLGTIPDYAAQVDGVKLSGVRAGGPAEAAGLQAGDVITRIGEREIHNFDEFMATFGVLSPGEPVEVEVRRDEKTLTLTMTPGAPRPRSR